MTIYNFGSINIDHSYRVGHFPGPGEILAASSYAFGLGGKGANQSAAAAKAGAKVHHIGAVGPDGLWTLDQLSGWGVDVSQVARTGIPTGHAIITIDAAAENTIVIFPGANRAVPAGLLEKALAGARPGDTLLFQNETDWQAEVANLAQERGLYTVYSAAPFDVTAVEAVLGHIDLLVLNAVEAEQLAAALAAPLDGLGVPEVLVTRGDQGAEWRCRDGRRVLAPAHKIAAVVDTTGAGDTFLGYFVAARDQGLDTQAALGRAAVAASLKVARPGTADAIPTAAEVDEFLDQ